MPPLGQSSSKRTYVVLVNTYVLGVKRKRRFAALHAVPAVREAVTLDYCKVSGIYLVLRLWYGTVVQIRRKPFRGKKRDCFFFS